MGGASDMGGGGRGPEYMEALDGLQGRTIFKVANIMSRIEDLNCLFVSYPNVSLMCRLKETIGPFGRLGTVVRIAWTCFISSVR